MHIYIINSILFCLVAYKNLKLGWCKIQNVVETSVIFQRVVYPWNTVSYLREIRLFRVNTNPMCLGTPIYLHVTN